MLGDEMGMEKKTYSARLSDEIGGCLRAYCKEENRSISNMIETILINYVEEREAREKIENADKNVEST